MVILFGLSIEMKAIFVFDLAYKVLGRDIVNVSNVVPICFCITAFQKMPVHFMEPAIFIGQPKMSMFYFFCVTAKIDFCPPANN